MSDRHVGDERSHDSAGPDNRAGSLSRREAAWVLRRCARQGHVIGWVADEAVAEHVVAVANGDGPTLIRCLRCGTWMLPNDVAVGSVTGSVDSPVGLGALPLPARGAHGRKIALLRLLAVERLLRGLALIAAAIAVYQVASDRVSLLVRMEGLLAAAGPLGEQLGLHLTESPIVTWAERALGGDGSTLQLAGAALVAYGGLQVLEGVGLWGGWRWAEYLAAMATSLFIPLEVYELVERPSPLKAVALTINVAAVGYLVYKGRLFGVRGGHAAYLDEVRETTLLGEILQGLGRSTGELTSERIV